MRKLLWLPYKVIKLIQRFFWFIGLPYHEHVFNECTPDFNCCEKFEGIGVDCLNCGIFYNATVQGISHDKCKDCGSINIKVSDMSKSQRFKLFN